MLLAQLRRRILTMVRNPTVVPLMVLLVVLLASASLVPSTEAFSFREYDINDNPETAGDVYVDMAKRYYRGWGHSVRDPWRRLPKTACYRYPCKKDKDCCRRYNICDISVKVCRDCWYGSQCKSEQDCCERYPYCSRIWRRTPSGRRQLVRGKCVNKL